MTNVEFLDGVTLERYLDRVPQQLRAIFIYQIRNAERIPIHLKTQDFLSKWGDDGARIKARRQFEGVESPETFTQAMREQEEISSEKVSQFDEFNRSVVDEMGQIIFEYGLERNLQAVATCILCRLTPGGFNCFHIAVCLRIPRLVTSVRSLAQSLDPSPSIQHLSKNGLAPLHLAVMLGNVDAVDEIIASGANIDMVAHLRLLGDVTPLWLSIVSGHLSCARCLLAHNCDVWVRNNQHFRQTVAHIAVFWNSEALGPILMYDPILASARDSRDKTPLHIAAENSAESLVTLLNHGADPNVQDVRGNTPLHSAWSVVVHIRQPDDQLNPFFLAKYHRQDLKSAIENREILISRGANPSIRNRDRLTPAQFGFNISMALRVKSGEKPGSMSGTGLYSWEKAVTNKSSAWFIRR